MGDDGGELGVGSGGTICLLTSRMSFSYLNLASLISMFVDVGVFR